MKRGLPREDFIEQDAQAVEVCLKGGGGFANCLGRDVGARPLNGLELAASDHLGEAFDLFAGQREIDEPNLTDLVHQHVVGLHVAMNPALRVDVRHRLANAFKQPACPHMNRRNVGFDLQLDVCRAEVLHRQIGVVAARRELLELDDERMIERLENFGFILQCGLVHFEFGRVCLEQLHGEMPPRRLLDHFPDLAAAAGGDAHHEFVRAVNQFFVGHCSILNKSRATNHTQTPTRSVSKADGISSAEPLPLALRAGLETVIKTRPGASVWLARRHLAS